MSGGDVHPLEELPTIETNLARVEAGISAACLHAQRSRSEVLLVAVTKMHPAQSIAAAISLGIEHFGENRVQEFEQKSSSLPANQENLRFHLIGHLQSNKSARAAALFSSVDSLDSLNLAMRLQDAAQRLGCRLSVLVEIKLGNEETKTGLAPGSQELVKLLEQLPDFENLVLRGLMTVPPYCENPESARAYFKQLYDLRNRLTRAYPRLDFSELSMGMSHDYAVAIEEGSTQVRIGAAIFGPRPKPA